MESMTPDTKEVRYYEIRQEWTSIPVVSANFKIVVSPIKISERILDKYTGKNSW